MNPDMLVLALIVAVGVIVLLLYRTHRLSGRIKDDAMTQFQAWRAGDLATIRQEQADVAAREAHLKLAEWKAGSESTIRADAIQRSQSVILGKVTEHIVPYLPEFTYNPKDVRFIGSPVDLVVFDGLDDEAVRGIVFLEVKSNTSTALTKSERLIRDAIKAGKVSWREIRLDPGRIATAKTAGN